MPTHNTHNFSNNNNKLRNVIENAGKKAKAADAEKQQQSNFIDYR